MKAKLIIKNSFESLDKRYIWHPFTQMKDYCSEEPLIIEKGKGIYLYDIYGKKYIDGVSSLWLTIHGHQKKELDDALRIQLKKNRAYYAFRIVSP